MHCEQFVLWTLVEQDDEPCEGLDSIAQHIETCASCRQELSRLGGEASWWQDAAEYLECAANPNQREGQEADLPPLPPIDLSFLDPPSHPEMLGRLGRYEVEGIIGRGGMGVVLRGYDADLHRSIAIKVLAPEWGASTPARRRFAREAQAAASVAHEHVVPIYSVEADASLPYLVMAYIPGMTLERWVKTHGVPDTGTLLRVAGQLTDGLAAAHRRGLVHRDVKPGNVLVGENIDRVWITDFGLARAADSVTLTRTGVIAGTPHYMSPEQARGEAIDHRSDLFSLGCVLYFLASGRPPFDADNTLAVLHKIVSTKAESLAFRRTDLPPSFVLLVERLLERRVDRRPGDCDTVSEWLQTAAEEVEQGRVASAPRSTRWRVTVALAGLCLLLAGAAWFARSSRRNAADSMFRRPSQETLPAPVINPWQTSGLQDPTSEQLDASPYVTGASDSIDSAIVSDLSRLQKQIQAMQRRAEQMSSSPDPLVTPSLSLEGDAWRKEIEQIKTHIQTLNTSTISDPTDHAPFSSFEAR